ncbi:unnamed protein product [Caenorhabditis angaria]|uniref:BTB domain-containing protein n=1 Tax=Caenorhabditis angaria TaxID=860376 RepID=A0A9P1MVA0_9PELO|nr:unnamed protein product [Caenorhabditis angaria]
MSLEGGIEDLQIEKIEENDNLCFNSHVGCTSCGRPSPPRRLFSSPPRQSASEKVSDGSGADICRYDFLASYNPPRRNEEKTEGIIKLNIANLSTLKSKTSTSFHMIANLPWRLAAKTEKTKRTSDVKFFSVYIDCNPESESTLWSCDAIVEFRLLSHKVDEGQVHFCRQFTNKFNFNSNNWGFPSFMEWSDITSNEKGYVKNDKVTVEARITVQKVIGVRNSPTFDFLAFQPNVADIMLVIDGRKLHVSKMYLALYSPVFYAMFFSNFKEREKKEIVVEDVVFEEFIELLNVVYPSHKSVNGENVEFLLELGDKFEIQYVIDECEKFLITSEEIATITKLVWADQYYLAKLQDSCLRTFKSVAEVKALKLTEEYKNLSDATKAALLEKMFKIVA